MAHFLFWRNMQKGEFDLMRLCLLLTLIFVCIFLSALAEADTDYQYVKVVGRQLMVDFDMNGDYEPYLIKGVGYSPSPIGRHPSDWGYPPEDPRTIHNIFDDPLILNRDFALLQDMNVNTIRLWKGDDTEVAGRFPNKLTQNTLDIAESYGIKVIPGFWIDTPGPWCEGSNLVYYPPAFLDPANPYYNIERDIIILRFKAFVEEFKDHPAILFWAIGNENNFKIPEEQYRYPWYSLINEMAYEAHLSEGSTYHPVACVNGDILQIAEHEYQMPDLDIWGTNVYRGISFGSLFSDFATYSEKPLWISEFGLDAWHTNDIGNPDDGYEDQATQALWLGTLWDEIVLNSDVAIGGTMMEYSDEWWKPWEWLDGGIYNSTQEHFGHGPTDTDCDGIPDWYPPTPDTFFNEEWFGIMAISLNPIAGDPDIMTPRDAYDILQYRFECGYDTGLYYAGPENGKSCDTSSACCNYPNKKSKNGYCVTRCGGGGCFLPGTAITLADGSLKPIEDIKVGDMVLSADEENNVVPNKVTELFIHPDEEGSLLVETKAGKQLRVTKIHRVMSDGEYKSIGELTIDSPMMILEDGKLIETTISSMRKVDAKSTVYNLEVENAHTYFAEDYLVHNMKPNVIDIGDEPFDP